jgi:hypothetical protein
MCVWTTIHLCWLLWENEALYTKHAVIITLFKPQTYAAVWAVNLAPELCTEKEYAVTWASTITQEVG